MSLIFSLFTTIVYQPFLNLLVFIYWILDFGSQQADMGIAVIILTLIIRFLLLPLSLSGSKSEKDRREIAAKVAEAHEVYADDPIKLREAEKKIMKKGENVVWGEMISLSIQTMIALMLYKIFKTGLEGKDIHLIYSFMPKVDLPFNLVFLNKFDLSKASITLNFIQSLFIFIFETLATMTSPYPHSKAELVRLQVTLPIVSFFIFMFMPAGKKLFVITTLVFSICLTLTKYIRRKFLSYKESSFAKASEDGQTEEKLVVDVK
ncbi:MAG: YidC/Oxa1 family membrane protein insertase [Patescibacteria group bacterium]